MTTFKVTIALTLAAITVPIDSPAEGVTRVEILDGTGADVASQDSGYVFPGIVPGDYSLRATLLDINGAAIGTPLTQAFSVVDPNAPPVVVDPNPPATTRVVQVPGVATVTVEAE